MAWSRPPAVSPSAPHPRSTSAWAHPQAVPPSLTPLFWRWMVADPGKGCPPDPAIQPKCRPSLLRLRKSPNSLAAEVCLRQWEGLAAPQGPPCRALFQLRALSHTASLSAPVSSAVKWCEQQISNFSVSGSLCPLNTTEDPKELLLVHAVATNISKLKRKCFRIFY